MGKTSLRALAREHIQALNTLIVGADVAELHDILAALSASQAHATCRLLEVSGGPACTKYLTLPEVAERLSVPEDTVREWGRCGEIPTVHLGRLVRVPEDALTRNLEGRSHGLRPVPDGKDVAAPSEARKLRRAT